MRDINVPYQSHSMALLLLDPWYLHAKILPLQSPIEAGFCKKFCLLGLAFCALESCLCLFTKLFFFNFEIVLDLQICKNSTDYPYILDSALFYINILCNHSKIIKTKQLTMLQCYQTTDLILRFHHFFPFRSISSSMIQYRSSCFI